MTDQYDNAQDRTAQSPAGKVAHTPGPWTKIRGELVGSNGKKVIEYGSGVAIMCGGGADPESVANTNLRNAAPDLLEALQRAQEELRMIRMRNSGVVYDTTLRLDMQLAIAKAVGQ